MRHMHNIDTYRSKKQILEELQAAASRAAEDGNIAHMTLTFAVLLVKLSDESTRNIIRLRRILFWLVILLIIIILPPVIRELYEFFTENTFSWKGPSMPDFPGYFSRFWSWLLDLWNSLKDWFFDIWK
jgi:hypothetical protein